MRMLWSTAPWNVQAEHYNRSRQQQIDVGLLAPEEAQASIDQVLCFTQL